MSRSIDLALEKLFQAFRASPFLSLPLNNAAKLLGATRRDVRAMAEAAPELELTQRTSTHGTFQIVRPTLTAENLARLAPVAVDQLRKAYGGSANARDLEQALAAGGEDGPFHVAGGEVRPGPGVSDPIRLARPGCMDQAPAEYDRGPFDEAEDLRVLSRLEDLEAARINFGVYETFVSFGELHAHLAGAEPGLRSSSADPAELRASLERLRLHQHVLFIGDDRYRSRISETVRVLKRVKQRFRADDAATRPYLVHSVRVHFEDRRRLERRHPLTVALETVFQENRGGGRKVDKARKALERGFPAAMGQAPEDVDLTRVQRDALRLIAGQYLREEGRGFVVTGNTGSGKTEAALLPLLLGAVEEKLRRPEEADGCKILLVYPRQELAKNQLQRLCRYLAFINRKLTEAGGEDGVLSAGIVFSDTPRNDAELTGGAGSYRQAWEPEGDGHALPYFTNDQDQPVRLLARNRGVGVLHSTPGGFDEDGWELEGFRATREAILRSPPDVLVITTEMLHRWLMSPDANRFFGLPAPGARAAAPTAPRAVVFDEIHLYDTTHGAQVGMLLRRLRHRLVQALSAGGQRRDPLVIGMSATIGNAQAFWSKLSGLPLGQVTPIAPAEEDLEAAQGREYFLFIRPETYSRGNIVGDASVAIQSIMAIAHNLRRRGPDEGDPPKHRSLVFQDSISKVKKLAVEFRDAETNKFLARHRLAPPAGPDPLQSAEFRDGEYWIFDAQDPFQYGERRPQAGDPPCSLTSRERPAFSGNKGSHLLKRDILFATTVLEVGYDDPSIQFVFQHHAPRNAASFVQKKGRAGRSLQDRPITAVTLSRHSFRDAFYYQNPYLLYSPEDYRPPLNVENYFVHRFQTLALLFDELARFTGDDLASFNARPSQADVQARLGQVDAAFGRFEASLESAFRHVAEESFRRVHPTLRSVWQWFRDDFADSEVVWGVRRARNLLRGHPQLPENLFGTINLPTLRVMYSRGDGSGDWEKPIEEDIALAFGELAPGKVSRRYGRGHRLFWRAPFPWVEIERFKRNRAGGRGDGPFNPDLLETLADLWGPDWADYLPLQLHRVYGGGLPDRFYRARYLELWDFGELNSRDPKQPQRSWSWWGELLPTGEAVVQYSRNPGQSPPVQWSRHFQRTRNARVNPWRRVSPDSTSFPLSSAYVRPYEKDAVVADSARPIPLPPLFPGLLDELRPYCGEVEGQRSALDVWEIHYGAEATIKLLPNRVNDPHAGTGHALVRYHGGPDEQPTLYGYDLTTEGLRAPYDPALLEATATAVFEEVWADSFRQSHLQDQYLRYLLKTGSWPPGAADPMNVFDVRVAADLISTLRAESRAQGVQGVNAFLDQLTDPAGLAVLLAEARARYWRDRRILNDEFVGRLTSTLTAPATRPFLDGVFQQLQSGGRVREFLQVVLLHSLKHAVRHLFITEGSTRDEEVGSFGMFRLTHRDWSPGHDFYVYERNQDGSGATRLVVEVLEEKGLPYRVERWWDVSLACPVGDEEDFLRAAFRQHGPQLRAISDAFFRADPAERVPPRESLEALFPGAPRGGAFLVRLAGILTSELGFGRGPSIPLVALHVEIQELEDALAARFRRPPSPAEVAGYAATEVEHDPDGARFPALGRLRELYRDHAHELGEHDDEAPSNDLERFMDQVQHLGLSTCTDACPACLASDCDLGHIEVMRHTLSRRHLKTAHRLLSAPFTVNLQPGVTTVDELAQVAGANGGWAILTYRDRLPTELALALRDGFEQVGRIFDHERMELRAILRLAEVG